MRRLVGVGVLLLLAGCRTPVPAALPLPPDDPRPAALLAELALREQSLQGVRARARVSIDGQRGASFAKQLLLIERPARLRVEVLGLLNQRIAVLATDGRRFDLYRAESGAVESGAVHPTLLWQVAGVPLTPQEAVALLLGAPVDLTAAAGPGSARELPGGGVRLELEDRLGLARAAEFDAAGRLRRYQRRAPDGETLLEVRWDDYRDAGGRSFAHQIAVEAPGAGARAELSFRSVEINPELPAALFELPGALPKAPSIDDA